MSEEERRSIEQAPDGVAANEATEQNTEQTETSLEATEEPSEIEADEDTPVNGGPTTNTENDTEPAVAEGEQAEQEEDDDDDFGDFSDASFDDFEEPQPAPGAPATSDPVIVTDNDVSSFSQELFQNPEKLQEKLDALCHEAFPRNMDKFEIPENTSILNERSTHLLERLVAQPYLKPYNWQRGSLRRQLLVTLGLPDDTVVHKERSNEFDMESYLVRTLQELHIDGDEKKQLMERSEEELQELSASVLSEQELSGMTEEELDEAMKKLEKDVGRVEKLLSVWEDEREKLEEDHRTYESVVENLVGHTQRLRREEALKSLKKEKKEGRLGLFKRLKKPN